MSARRAFCSWSASSSVLWIATAVLLWCTVCQCRQSKSSIGDHIRYYEPVDYDLSTVANEYSAWRDAEDDPNRHRFSMAIWAFGRVFRLILSEDKGIFSPGASFQAGNGSDTFEYDPLSHHVEGYVHGEESSYVHGFIVDGRFRGVVDIGSTKYHIEPALAHFPRQQSFHSIMYRESDVDTEKALGGGSIDMKKFIDLQVQRVQGGRRSRRATLSDAARSNVECIVAVTGDHLFAALVAKEEAVSMADGSALRAAMTRVMALYIREANKILTVTTFLTTSEAPEGIRVAIGTVMTYITTKEMKTFHEKTRLHEDFLGAEKFLSEFSKVSWDRYCLSHIFTNRQFDQGILGLAFVTGACEKFGTGGVLEASNTGMMTHSNSGNRLPTSVLKLVYTHEIGHNLGSQHDEGACIPPDEMGGKYIMYANANDGTQANNREFSPCSKAAISTLLKTKAFARRGCFRPPSNGSFCTNRVREGDEQCDCGLPSQCAAEHFCCTEKCKLQTGSSCSPQQGPCCNSSTCNFVPSSDKVTCSEPQECRMGLAKCSGSSSECPVALAREDGIICGKGRASCLDGECTGSLCTHVNLTRCFCAAPAQCHVCCNYNDKCQTLSSIGAASNGLFNTSGLSLFLPAGSACNDFAGTCNFLHYCRQLSDTGLLLAVHNFLFSTSTYIAAYEWLKNHWWAGFPALFGLIVFFSLVIHFCSYKTPQKTKKKSVGRRSTAHGLVPKQMTQVSMAQGSSPGVQVTSHL